MLFSLGASLKSLNWMIAGGVAAFSIHTFLLQPQMAQAMSAPSAPTMPDCEWCSPPPPPTLPPQPSGFEEFCEPTPSPIVSPVPTIYPSPTPTEEGSPAPTSSPSPSVSSSPTPTPSTGVSEGSSTPPQNAGQVLGVTSYADTGMGIESVIPLLGSVGVLTTTGGYILKLRRK